ncbi:MAG: hypothetical protein JNM41_11585 [Flavipsychrobacter sp.]|nr:hypothetical protein [Flavipsychrobacter sp.]
MNGNNNISQGGKDPRLTEEKMLAYLEGRLSPAEQHEVERWLSEEGMESDAMEGLQSMPSMDRHRSVARLNSGLNKRVSKRSRRVKRASPGANVVFAVLLILVLVVLVWLVFQRLW